MRPLTATLVLLSTLVVLLVSGSAAARPTGVVAPLNPLGIEAAEARRVQRWVTSAVIAVPGHRWLASSRLNKLLRSPRRRGCSAEPRCLGNLGRKIGAALVVGGDVGSLSGAYMAHQLLTPERYHGTIAVKVDVKNAWIYLDGQRTARSPAKPLTRVSVGTHALRVTHASYRDFVRFVKVGFGQTVGVDVALSAFPVRGASMEAVEQDLGQPLADHELPWYRRWWAVAGFGAVVLAATTATVAVLAGRSVGRDAEVLVRP